MGILGPYSTFLMGGSGLSFRGRVQSGPPVPPMPTYDIFESLSVKMLKFKTYFKLSKIKWK